MCSRIESSFNRAGSLALVAGLLLSGTSVLAQQVRDELRRAIILVENEDQPSEGYWIGIQLEALPGSLRAQLELPEGQGVLVEEVVPESPAAQAGLLKHDVIVRAGEKTLTNPQDLVDAVAQAKESELNLELLRVAKKMTLAVKPAKRPLLPGDIIAEGPAEVDAGKLQELIQQFLNQHPGGGMRMRMLQPGMVLPPRASSASCAAPGSALPENLSITIHRQGNHPANISVKQDDKSWELTEDKLQELPPNVRFHVEQMLGGIPTAQLFRPGATMRPPVRVEITPNQVGPEIAGQPHLPRRARVEAERVEGRLDELSKQIQELREAIEKLRKQAEAEQK